jgi:hypothetical protein
MDIILRAVLQFRKYEDVSTTCSLLIRFSYGTDKNIVIVLCYNTLYSPRIGSLYYTNFKGLEVRRN